MAGLTLEIVTPEGRKLHEDETLLTELSEAAPLTRRERQIAELARDHRSAEIAAILHLSVRTVENHLARAFKKLGISSRAELPSQSDD